jgi:hypothetical protein
MKQICRMKLIQHTIHSYICTSLYFLQSLCQIHHYITIISLSSSLIDFTAVLRDTRPPHAKRLRVIVVFDIQAPSLIPQNSVLETSTTEQGPATYFTYL